MKPGVSMKLSTLVPLLLLALPFSASSQAVHTFLAVDGLGGTHEKLLYTALVSMDQEALFSTHGDQFKVRSQVRPEELLTAFNAAGAGEVRLVQDRAQGVPPFPVEQHTGNDAADEAAYEAAKAAWIAAHPDAYKALVAPATGTGTSNPE
jgi:hypothetical protein